MGSSGGPITKDNTSIEYYGTIFAMAESHHEKGVIWTGSDDGRVHVTRNDGDRWQDVTPGGLPEWAQVNSIDIHPFERGGAYVAATGYKSDDFRPYLFRTTDWGKS
ncbi:MAG: glycosyl hydrolase, partial [Woeseiales bacterium]